MSCYPLIMTKIIVFTPQRHYLCCLHLHRKFNRLSISYLLKTRGIIFFGSNGILKLNYVNTQV